MCVGSGDDSWGLGGVEANADVGTAIVTLSGSVDLHLQYSKTVVDKVMILYNSVIVDRCGQRPYHKFCGL